MEINYTNSKNENFVEYLIEGKREDEILPYILVIPENLKEGKEIIVESLNFEGTNIIDRIVPHVTKKLHEMAEIINDAPILIPFTPDVKGGIPYYQQLSRECFEESIDGKYKIDYPRIDLQIINTINDAKSKIEDETNMKVAEKIFLNGYSSSGVFAQRFALIHPEIVSRVLIGGASGSIPLPVEEFEYPLGTRDFRKLFGKDFDENEYRKIQFAYYVGELEANELAYEVDIDGKPIQRDENGQIIDKNQIIPPMHDMSYYPRSIDISRGKYQRQLLGEDLSERYEKCIKYYENNGYNITSKIYRGANHRGMFSKSNPCIESLLKDITLYYKYGEKFQEDITSVKKIETKSQKEQDEKNCKEI